MKLLHNVCPQIRYRLSNCVHMSVHRVVDVCQKHLGFIPWWKLTWAKSDRAYQNMNMQFFLGLPLQNCPWSQKKMPLLQTEATTFMVFVFWSVFLELNSKYCAGLKCTAYNFPSLQIACNYPNPGITVSIVATK